MTDDRFDLSGAGGRSPGLGAAIDAAVGKITTGIVIAGAIVGFAVYSRPAPPRYDAFAFGNRIIRVDSRTGSIIACEGQQTCQLVLHPGQRLTRVKRTDALPAPAPTPAPAPASITPQPAAPAAGK